MKTKMKFGFPNVKASKTICVEEVCRNTSFITPMMGGMLYAMGERSTVDNAGLKKAIFEKLFENGFIDYADDTYYSDDEYVKTEKGIDFCNRVDARFQTRHGVKYGYDLFPFEANIPEIQMIRS